MTEMSTQPVPGQRSATHGVRFGGVVVGFDGTWHSRPALARAADEAVERGLELTVLTVVPEPSDLQFGARARTSDATERWDLAVERVRAATADLRLAHPGLAVSSEMLWDHDEDVEQFERDIGKARLIVLGDGGNAGQAAFLLGSTSRQLVRGTRCPILVVPDGESAAGQSSGVVAPERVTMATGAVVVGAGGPEVVDCFAWQVPKPSAEEAACASCTPTTDLRTATSSRRPVTRRTTPHIWPPSGRRCSTG